MQLKRTTRRKPSNEAQAAKFGEMVTADHLIAQDIVDESILGDKTALVVLDRGTKWLDVFPLLDKSAEQANLAMIEFMGNQIMGSFYTDGSPELRKVAEGNHWKHSTSTPGRPETNGVAERAVRTAVEGARTALEHAGLPPRWWNYAVRHFCMASNIAIVDNESSWQRRHGGGAFKGLRVPFGCLIDFKPSPTRGKATPKFAPKAVPGFSWDIICYQGDAGEATTGLQS